MGEAHALVGQLAVVLAIIATTWSVALAATRRGPGALFLGSLLWLVVVVVVAAILGAATAVAVAPPHDPLHIVYGVFGIAVLPGAVLVAAGRPARRQSIVAAVGTIVLVILLFRLVQTGG